MAQMNMKEAIRDAMRVELKRDPNVLDLRRRRRECRWRIPCNRRPAKRIRGRACI